MDMLKHANDPNFRGVIVRRLTPQIYGPGGVWQTAINMYKDIFGEKMKIRKRDGEIEFPSGALIKFRHCQYSEDMYSFQG